MTRIVPPVYSVNRPAVKPDPVSGCIWLSLTQNEFALIDECDSDLDQYNWSLLTSNSSKMKYAERPCNSKDILIKTTHIQLHKIIGNRMGFDSILIDHKDGDGLNCRRSNLRPASKRDNGYNRGKNSNNTSGYKGVIWNKPNKKWVAQIMYGKKQLYLGSFLSKEEAALAYNQAALKYAGEFAKLNVLK